MSADRWSAFDKPRPEMTRAAQVGNLVLRTVLLSAGGVDKHTLTNLVALKNALAEDFLRDNGGEDKPTAEYVADVHDQLAEFAANHSEEGKARETEEARERFCRRQGIKFVPRGEAGTWRGS